MSFLCEHKNIFFFYYICLLCIPNNPRLLSQARLETIIRFCDFYLFDIFIYTLFSLSLSLVHWGFVSGGLQSFFFIINRENCAPPLNCKSFFSSLYLFLAYYNSKKKTEESLYTKTWY